MIKYHNTLTTYINDLLKCGFIIKEAIEPIKDILDEVEGMNDELSRPIMLLVSARKASNSK